MMIPNEHKKKIEEIWEQFGGANQEIRDTRGNPISNIDSQRVSAIADLKEIIASFVAGNLNIFEFKTSVDSYNKRNNLWGFTATKGQMFFNQLVRNSEKNIGELTTLLKEIITKPVDLPDALERILRLESYTKDIFLKAKEKKTAAKPGSTGYFLSYFWQIHDHERWPIIYTSLISAFESIGIWQEHASQKEDYEFFYALNEGIKAIIQDKTQKMISNWEVEHAFWNFMGQTVKSENKPASGRTAEPSVVENTKGLTRFQVSDYLIPKVAKLIELGNSKEKSGSAKGSEYEKLVGEIFRFLDFEVEVLGQGTGRNPDAIAKYREENTAFIIDAKAYSNGYNLGIDDRAIKEYINHYCPRLQKDGYKKIGFIIVSNAFKSDFQSFINDITWNTDIKRFCLLTSEALLYLLAYKIKDKLSLSSIIESLVSSRNIISAQDIIEEFEDV